MQARAYDPAGNAGFSHVATMEIGGNPRARMPLNFEANQGQVVSPVAFLARTQGYNAYFTQDSIILGLTEQQATGAVTEPLEMQFAGSDPSARLVAIDPQQARTNYFIGNDPSQWFTDVPNYGEVHYANLYTGIDLVAHDNGATPGHLEYDFLVAPGADTTQIHLNFGGAVTPTLDAAGTLVLILPSGTTVTETAPTLYQNLPSGQRAVTGSFTLLGNSQVGFAVGSYDHTLPLFIDPVVSATYLGGSQNDRGVAIAVDPAGDTFVTGDTQSNNFPVTAGAFQTAKAGLSDAFVLARTAVVTPPPPPPPPGGGGGASANDFSETNQGSDVAIDFGAIGTGRPQTILGQAIAPLPDGELDYDWYRWTMAAGGTFVATTTTTSGGPLELHLFTLDSNNTLINLSDNISGGTLLSVYAAAAAGQPILVEVKGHNTGPGVMSQGTYNLNVHLQ